MLRCLSGSDSLGTLLSPLPMNRLLALLFLLLVGCKPTDESAATAGGSSKDGKGRLFAVSFMTMNNPFFVDLNSGIKKVVEAHGDRLVTLDGQHNSLKQKNDLSD